MATLSVVIASKNCRDRIEGTVVPWKEIAQEIIVVDQHSVDGTADLASQLGCKVIVNEPAGGNFDLNRKIGMLQARGDWLLYIDTDERPTLELVEEISSFLKADSAQGDIEGVRIPNLFYFLGKPLMHGIYNPNSAEIRMVRSGRWDYPCEKGFHHGVSVGGKVVRFKNAYKHFNVNSLSEWFLKTNQYTEHDARKNYKQSHSRRGMAFGDAFLFFVKHYFFKRGFLDGFHGLVAVFYFMLYHLTLQVKLWEYQYKEKLIKNEDYLDPIEGSKR